MATRTPHTGIAGEILTAANLAKYPKGWLGYAAATGPTTVDTTEDSVVTVTPTVPADRLVKITVSASVADGDNNSTGGTLRIERDGTDLGRVHRHGDAVELSYAAGFQLDTPTAGAHTYALVGETDTGDISVANATILVEDIGPAS